MGALGSERGPTARLVPVNVQRPPAKLRVKLGLSLASLLGLALAVELVLRLVGFSHLPAVLPLIVWNAEEDKGLRGGMGMFVEDRAQLWVPRPGAEVPYDPSNAERINAAGYRGSLRTPQPAEGVLRIVALGDSSTFGMGVPYAQTWCAKLEACLRAEGVPAEVIDLGVIGYTVEQGLERFETLGAALHPQIVIAAFGAVNEHFWAQSLSDRAKIDARKQLAQLQRFLAKLRLELRVLHGCAWIVDRLRGEDRAALREAWKQQKRERDAFNLGVGEVDWKGERRVSLTRFGQALDDLDERVRDAGARLVLISMPRYPENEVAAPVLVLYNQAVEQAAQRLGAPCFDARAAVAEAMAGPPSREWSELFVDAYHPSPAGHALFAAGLAPLIKSLAAERQRENSPASGR